MDLTIPSGKISIIIGANGLKVRELVAYGRFPHQKIIGGLNNHDKEVINWTIEETGLSEFADREIENLSGGQRQRLGLP